MNKKLISMTLVVLIISLVLGGCGNSVVKKSIEQAKASMESKEYDKALLSLEMALDEDSKNKEAKELYSILETYQSAKQLLEEKKFDEAKKTIDKIASEYANYSIKEDVDLLKTEIEKSLEAVKTTEDNLANVKKLVEEKKYDEAKALIKEITPGLVLEDHKSAVKALQERIDSELAAIEAQKMT